MIEHSKYRTKTVNGNNTGCLTVSVSTLIAYFWAIVEDHEISFLPCKQQGSGIFLKHDTPWYMQRYLRKL